MFVFQLCFYMTSSTPHCVIELNIRSQYFLSSTFPFKSPFEFVCSHLPMFPTLIYASCSYNSVCIYSSFSLIWLEFSHRTWTKSQKEWILSKFKLYNLLNVLRGSELYLKCWKCSFTEEEEEYNLALIRIFVDMLIHHFMLSYLSFQTVTIYLCRW